MKYPREKAIEEMAIYGLFKGLSGMLRFDQMPRETYIKARRNSYALVNHKVQEAKKELFHIQIALNQLEEKCRRGANSNFTDPSTEEAFLWQDCNRLEGWAISLVESIWTLEAMILDRTADDTGVSRNV